VGLRAIAISGQQESVNQVDVGNWNFVTQKANCKDDHTTWARKLEIAYQLVHEP
jgi:hypothetical protein